MLKLCVPYSEFFYIQMEKYARQALADGVKSANELVVTTDAEIYRVLILHYNRNNQIEVCRFLLFAVHYSSISCKSLCLLCLKHAAAWLVQLLQRSYFEGNQCGWTKRSLKIRTSGIRRTQTIFIYYILCQGDAKPVTT